MQEITAPKIKTNENTLSTKESVILTCPGDRPFRFERNFGVEGLDFQVKGFNIPKKKKIMSGDALAIGFNTGRIISNSKRANGKHFSHLSSIVMDGISASDYIGEMPADSQLAIALKDTYRDPNTILKLKTIPQQLHDLIEALQITETCIFPPFYPSTELGMNIGSDHMRSMLRNMAVSPLNEGVARLIPAQFRLSHWFTGVYAINHFIKFEDGNNIHLSVCSADVSNTIQIGGIKAMLHQDTNGSIDHMYKEFYDHMKGSPSIKYKVGTAYDVIGLADDIEGPTSITLGINYPRGVKITSHTDGYAYYYDHAQQDWNDDVTHLQIQT
jgi:hypothetical protein